MSTTRDQTYNDLFHDGKHQEAQLVERIKQNLAKVAMLHRQQRFLAIDEVKIEIRED